MLFVHSLDKRPEQRLLFVKLLSFIHQRCDRTGGSPMSNEEEAALLSLTTASTLSAAVRTRLIACGRLMSKAHIEAALTCFLQELDDLVMDFPLAVRNPL